MREEPMLIEVPRHYVDAAVYTVLTDEIRRLKVCRSRKEREEIRDFIEKIYLSIAEKYHENTYQEIIAGNTLQENLQPNT